MSVKGIVFEQKDYSYFGIDINNLTTNVIFNNKIIIDFGTAVAEFE